MTDRRPKAVREEAQSPCHIPAIDWIRLTPSETDVWLGPTPSETEITSMLYTVYALHTEVYEIFWIKDNLLF